MTTDEQPGLCLPDLPCACAALRRAARAVTQLYADELRDHLEPSQFFLLSVLSHKPGASQATLGEILAFDKTTLSRNLRLMQKNGWIEPAPAKDRRERGYQLTTLGQGLLHSAQPAWKRAQSRLQAAMSESEWEAMWNTMRTVTGAAVASTRPQKGTST